MQNLRQSLYTSGCTALVVAASSTEEDWAGANNGGGVLRGLLNLKRTPGRGQRRQDSAHHASTGKGSSIQGKSRFLPTR